MLEHVTFEHQSHSSDRVPDVQRLHSQYSTEVQKRGRQQPLLPDGWTPRTAQSTPTGSVHRSATAVDAPEQFGVRGL
jgi:hypothetical protein